MPTSAIQQYDSVDFSPLLDYARDEVVTRSFVKYIPLKNSGGQLALVTLDNGKDFTRPNTLGPHGLLELRDVLRSLQNEAALKKIQAVAVTGSPFILAAGADLSKVQDIPNRETGVLMVKLGHQALGLLGEMGVPSFCFINGLALGGGLEIALNADYRTVSSGAAALALPEVFLGLLPGWGGAWLLPNLIGIKNALKIAIENPLKMNRTLKPNEAVKLGLADAVFPSARFLEDSIEFADGVVSGKQKVKRPHEPGAVERKTVWPVAIAAARSMLKERIGEVALSPYAALELLSKARNTKKSDGFAAEDEALASLIAGDQFHASIYSFMLTQRRAKNTPNSPDLKIAQPITKVGVVGAGLMARQLAFQILRRLEIPVVISDISQDQVNEAILWMRGEIDGLEEKGRLHSDVANKLRGQISGTTLISDFKTCDLVIEAVFEELGVKQEVFKELEKHVRPDTILASNTSSLSIDEIAAAMKAPKRMLGIHFFNPVAVMPLVEVVKGEKSSKTAIATGLELVSRLKKTSIITADTTGFVVNRLLARLLGEAMHAIEIGTEYKLVDESVMPLGLPMGPFELLELVGLQIGAHVLETHHRAFPERFFNSQALESLVSHGKIYDRDKRGKVAGISQFAKSLVGSGKGYSVAELRERVYLGLADEVARMLDEKVVETAEDIDIAMILGAGWPFHMGGLTPFLDREGASEKIIGRSFHSPPIRGLS